MEFKYSLLTHEELFAPNVKVGHLLGASATPTFLSSKVRFGSQIGKNIRRWALGMR